MLAYDVSHLLNARHHMGLVAHLRESSVVHMIMKLQRNLRVRVWLGLGLGFRFGLGYGWVG